MNGTDLNLEDGQQEFYHRTDLLPILYKKKNF